MKKLLTILSVLLVSTFTLSSCTFTKINNDPTVDNIFSDDVIVNTSQTQITETYNKVEPACVGIQATSKQSGSVGSGVIYRILDAKTKGEITNETTDVVAYVVTNAHVVVNKTAFKVFVDETKAYNADLIGKDTKNDLAVLKFSSKYVKDELGCVDIFNNTINSPQPGSMALAIGCPLEISNFNFPTLGLISKSTATQIAHSVAINPGNSGGGLFDVVTGELLGINVSKRVYIPQTDDNGNNVEIPVDNIGYAIPIWVVQKVVKDIEETNSDIQRPLLGITVGLVSASLENNNSDVLPAELNSGVVIFKVDENSNASRATCENNQLVEKGLLSGDIITTIDNQKITRMEDLSFVMSTQTLNSIIKVSVIRKIDGVWCNLEFLIKLV